MSIGVVRPADVSFKTISRNILIVHLFGLSVVFISFSEKYGYIGMFCLFLPLLWKMEEVLF